MKYKLFAVISFVLLCNNSTLFAQNSGGSAFTLKQAQTYALEHNIAIKNVQLSIKYSKKQVLETTSIGLPHINADLTYTNFIDIPTSLIPGEIFGQSGNVEVQFGTEQDLTFQLVANQLLFDGTYIVGLQAARVYVDLTKKQSQLTEIDISVNVAKAYYANLIVKEQVDIVTKNVQNLEKTYFETDQMYQNGFVEKLDVDRLKLALSGLQIQLQNLKRQKVLANTVLKFHMGYPLKDSIIIIDSLQGLIDHMPADVSPNLDIRNRIEFQALQTQISLAKLNIRRYRYGYLPSASAFFSHQDNAPRNVFNFFVPERDWFKTNLWGLKLQLPIFDGFSKSAKIQQAKIDLLQLKNNEQNLDQALSLEVQKAKTNYINGLRQMETQLKNLTLAEEIYQTTLVKYNEGVGSSIEMSNAQSELYKTQATYISALYDLLNAKTDLDKALGNN